MRRSNFVHTSCPPGKKYNTPPAGVRGFAGMNPSPIPAKEKASLCALCDLERPEGVGVRKKPLNALSLARFARARRVRRETIACIL